MKRVSHAKLKELNGILLMISANAQIIKQNNLHSVNPLISQASQPIILLKGKVKLTTILGTMEVAQSPLVLLTQSRLYCPKHFTNVCLLTSIHRECARSWLICARIRCTIQLPLLAKLSLHCQHLRTMSFIHNGLPDFLGSTTMATLKTSFIIQTR